jgi:hypothetical protein|tara:strand:+ start:30 stop:236 length:207 start_codon:yes stop_codon:yes gene_type:complete
VKQAGVKSFGSRARKMSRHYKIILNYFDSRSTNVSAESFDTKTNALRKQFRRGWNTLFFLFLTINVIP